MTATRKEVYAAIDSERDYQDEHHGGPDHDYLHSVDDWGHFMLLYCQQFRGPSFDLLTNEEQLSIIRKITALGVAAMEVHGAPLRK